MAKGICEKGTENKEDFDESVSDALDVIFSREEETYDQLLQSFRFLKKGTIKISASTTSLQPVVKQTRRMATQDDEDAEGITSIATEELGPGEQSGTMTVPSRAPVGRIINLKLDNFIGQERDTDSESEDNEDTTSCYVPSALQPCNPDQPTVITPVLKGHNTNWQSNDKISTKEDQNFQNSLAGLDDQEDKIGACYSVVPTFPGEVDSYEMKSSPSAQGVLEPNIRCLQITESLRLAPDHKEDNEIKQDVEDTECVVETFQLDSDFDYDNIPFTPKFDFVQRKLS